MFDYRNNEDAGDLSAMGYADYCAEMAEERHYANRRTYVEQFDHDMGGSPAYSIKVDSRWNRWKTISVHGPKRLPCCEQCSKELTRDEYDGRVHRGDAVLLCSGDCLDDYNASAGGWDSGREFPTYG